METLSYSPEEDELENNREFFDLANFPEQYRELAERHSEDFLAILEQTLPPKLIDQAISRIIFEPNEPIEVNNRYGVSAVATCETGGTIKIFEGFFEKSYAEQQYVLMHEVGHALSSVIFSEPAMYEELSSLSRSSDTAGETNYVRHVAELNQQGKLDDRALLAEQTAERLAAYLLSGGDLTNMLEIQAAYLRNPEELFRGIPKDALSDKDQLKNYLEINSKVNALVDQTSLYHQLIRRAIEQPHSKVDDGADWDSDFIDDSILGESKLLNTYTEHHGQSATQTKPLWSFLFELLFPQKQS